MKTRAEAAAYWAKIVDDCEGRNKEQLTRELGFDKGWPYFNVWHIGRMEVRALMDFIYGGPPQNDSEKVK